MSSPKPTTVNTSNASAISDLGTRLTAPVSPTETGTERATAEARRRTSDWKPPEMHRTMSYAQEEHKRQMMAASGALQKD